MPDETVAAETVTIPNELGLHARPAMAFAQLAMTFESRVAVRRRGGKETVDGKSIMQMLLLAATRGSQLEIECTGPDGGAAVLALAEFVRTGCGEGV